jgi:hypothetical protein
MKDRKFEFIFMKRDTDPLFEYCSFDYLSIKILRFSFKWFLDCGDWFIYITWRKKKEVVGYRFSSAGNMKVNYKID